MYSTALGSETQKLAAKYNPYLLRGRRQHTHTNNNNKQTKVLEYTYTTSENPCWGREQDGCAQSGKLAVLGSMVRKEGCLDTHFQRTLLMRNTCMRPRCCKTVEGSCGTAQLGKSLPRKHKNLSLILNTQMKGLIPGSCWPANLTYLISSRSVRDPVLQKQMDSE